MAKVREGKFAPLQTKLLWTALFFVCFMIGRNIPIRWLDDTASGSGGHSGELLNAANVATGGDFFSPSFFSLGLGPWMGAAILWRFLFIGKLARNRKIPHETVKRTRYALMLILAVIQAIGLMSSYHVGRLTWGPFDGQVEVKVLVVLILVVGACLVAWMAQRNEDLGLGGIMMFILYQILLTVHHNWRTFTDAYTDHTRIVWVVIAACICVILLGVFAGNAEVRLHVNKVSIDNGFTGVSYLPVKLNPGGASPMMYSLALLALPQYVARAIGAVIPSTSTTMGRFVSSWGLSSPAGFTVYLVLLFVLSIFFGLITVDPKDAARRMGEAGEYFDYVEPGLSTRRFIRAHVVVLSAVSGVLLVILAGLPLHFIGTYPELQYVLMAPGTVMVVLSLLWMLQEEITDTTIGRKYSFTFGRSSRRAAA